MKICINTEQPPVTFFSRGSQVPTQNKQEPPPQKMQQKRRNEDGSVGQQAKKVTHDNIDSDLLAQSVDAAAAAVEEAQKAGEVAERDEEQLKSEAKEHHEDAGEENTDAADESSERATQDVLHPSSSADRPLPGTAEWHRQRKDNHKEVERRRRETINTGIKELASLLPTPETNKSQVLQRSIDHIKRLQENEKNNMEKWTLEKLLNDQAVSELTAANEKLKNELERAYREVEHWKKIVNIAKGSEQ